MLSQPSKNLCLSEQAPAAILEQESANSDFTWAPLEFNFSNYLNMSQGDALAYSFESTTLTQATELFHTNPVVPSFWKEQITNTKTSHQGLRLDLETSEPQVEASSPIHAQPDFTAINRDYFNLSLNGAKVFVTNEETNKVDHKNSQSAVAVSSMSANEATEIVYKPALPHSVEPRFNQTNTQKLDVAIVLMSSEKLEPCIVKTQTQNFDWTVKSSEVGISPVAILNTLTNGKNISFQATTTDDLRAIKSTQNEFATVSQQSDAFDILLANDFIFANSTQPKAFQNSTETRGKQPAESHQGFAVHSVLDSVFLASASRVFVTREGLGNVTLSSSAIFNGSLVTGVSLSDSNSNGSSQHNSSQDDGNQNQQNPDEDSA